MIVCLPRPQGGLKPVSAHFRTSGTTSGETFVVTDGPLKVSEVFSLDFYRSEKISKNRKKILQKLNISVSS